MKSQTYTRWAGPITSYKYTVISPLAGFITITPFTYLGGGFKYFLFSPLVGEDFQFD